MVSSTLPIVTEENELRLWMYLGTMIDRCVSPVRSWCKEYYVEKETNRNWSSFAAEFIVTVHRHSIGLMQKSPLVKYSEELADVRHNSEKMPRTSSTCTIQIIETCIMFECFFFHSDGSCAFVTNRNTTCLITFDHCSIKSCEYTFLSHERSYLNSPSFIYLRYSECRIVDHGLDIQFGLCAFWLRLGEKSYHVPLSLENNCFFSSTIKVTASLRRVMFWFPICNAFIWGQNERKKIPFTLSFNLFNRAFNRKIKKKVFLRTLHEYDPKMIRLLFGLR